MTQMIERPIAVDGTPCTGNRHTPSNSSYSNEGCRCPQTVVAREQFLRRRQAERERVRRTFEETGVCTARTHGTAYAYETNGCCCSGSRDKANQRASRINADIERRWKRWRGPDTRVNRISLEFAVAGYRTIETHGELVAAVIALTGKTTSDGWASPIRPMLSVEIGERLGVSREKVRRVYQEIRRNREERPARRLADVQMKALRLERSRARRSH